MGVKHSKNGKVMVHCWRGGMRSEFFAFLLHYYGLEPNLLIGGYKSYRNSVHETFGSPLQLNVLAGKTGSGKTELLHSLKEKGEQIIDLEFLAKHRGSAFGALGFESKPSQEQFENDLSEILRTIDLKKRVWIEDENRTIGDKVIPESLWKIMLSAPRVIIERPFEDRLNRVVADYGSFSRSDLIVSMEKIGKRLGPQHVKKAVEHLTSGEVREAFSIALGYYDKAYSFQLSKIEKNDMVIIETDGLSEEDLILKLISVKTNGN
jgi:tRNA 2-selenouridine synthase